MPAGSRLTINVALEDASLAATSVATRVTSDVGVVAERAMYWPFDPGRWQEAHNAFGVTETAPRWGLAEGRAGGPLAFQTFVLVANPGTTAANRDADLPAGRRVRRSRRSRWSSRRTPDHLHRPGLDGAGAGQRILRRVMASDQPVFAERALYSNANGVLGRRQRRHGDGLTQRAPSERLRLRSAAGARIAELPPFSSQRACPAEEETCMRNRDLCAAVLAAAHAATAGAQPAPAPLPAGDGWVALTIADYLKLRDQANRRPAPPLRRRRARDGVRHRLRADRGRGGWPRGRPSSRSTSSTTAGSRCRCPRRCSCGRPASAAGRWRSRTAGSGRRLAGRLAGASMGSGSRRILLSRRGRSLVTLDVAVPIAETAGNEHIQLPPATGGLVRATLTVPRADVAIAASGGTIIERTGEPSARRVTAHAALGQALGLSWSRQRETTGASLPARLRGQLQHVVGLGEETALVTARVTVDVLRGGHLGVHARGCRTASSSTRSRARTSPTGTSRAPR